MMVVVVVVVVVVVMMMMVTLKILKFYGGIWKKKLNIYIKRKQVDCEIYIICDERYCILVCVGIL